MPSARHRATATQAARLATPAPASTASASVARDDAPDLAGSVGGGALPVRRRRRRLVDRMGLGVVAPGLGVGPRLEPLQPVRAQPVRDTRRGWWARAPTAAPRRRSRHGWRRAPRSRTGCPRRSCDTGAPARRAPPGWAPKGASTTASTRWAGIFTRWPRPSSDRHDPLDRGDHAAPRRPRPPTALQAGLRHATFPCRRRPRAPWTG